MSKVHYLDVSKGTPKIEDMSKHRSGEPPSGSDDMEIRVQKLEKLTEMMSEKLNNISSAIIVIEKTVATEASLHKEISNQTWKLITWMTTVSGVLSGAIYYIVKHSL